VGVAEAEAVAEDDRVEEMGNELPDCVDETGGKLILELLVDKIDDPVFETRMEEVVEGLIPVLLAIDDIDEEPKVAL
jgi:hypothetical protein